MPELRELSQTDPLLHTTTYNYDEAGRLTSTVDALNHTTTCAYDGPGNLTGVTDQASRTIQYTFDLNNQLKSVSQPGTVTTAYDYDVRGNLTTITDANGSVTQNAFDLLNRRTTETMPGGTLTQTSTYDAAGNQAPATLSRAKRANWNSLNWTNSRLLGQNPRAAATDVGNRRRLARRIAWWSPQEIVQFRLTRFAPGPRNEDCRSMHDVVAEECRMRFWVYLGWSCCIAWWDRTSNAGPGDSQAERRAAKQAPTQRYR